MNSLALIAMSIGALQKLVLLLDIGYRVYDGSLFEAITWYLLPPEEDGSAWMIPSLKLLSGSVGRSGSGQCQSVFGLYPSHACIRSELMVGHSGLKSATAGMAPVWKMSYVLVVRVAKALAPYAVQLTLVLVPVYVYKLSNVLYQNVLQNRDLPRVWPKVRQVVSHRRFNILNTAFLLPGVVITSIIVCRFTEGSQTACSQLLCFQSFRSTIFRDAGQTGYWTRTRDLGRSSLVFRTFRTVTTFVTTALLISLLYVCTLAILCLVVYVIYDAAASAWRTGVGLKNYISNSGQGEALEKTWSSLRSSMRKVVQNENT